MKVLLQRDFSVAGQFFKRDPLGTEIPDELGGRKVVLFSEWDRDNDKEIPLPNEAVLFTVAGPADPTLLLRSSPSKPIALSQLPNPPSPEEMLAKKAK